MDERQVGIAPVATPSRMTDEELLLEYRSTGAESVFAQLVRRYERELYSYLRRYLGNAAMAEDVFQMAFLQVHLKCDQFEEDRRFRPWLYSIATNQAIDAQRRNRRHRHLSLDRPGRKETENHLGTLLDMMENQEPGPVAQLEAEERGEIVRRAVADLPDQLRSTISLIYYQGLKYREAAEVLSIPVGTVKSRVHAAVLKLNEAWTEAQKSGAEEHDA